MVHLKVISKFDFNFSMGIYPNDETNLNNWFLDFDLKFNKNPQYTGESIQIDIQIPELNYKFVDVETTNQIQFQLSVDDRYPIELWYPAGYGEQKLYRLIVTCTLNGSTITKVKTIGFRSVHLIQDPISDSLSGLTFYFKINRIPIFLKGSNWIPIDVFKDRINQTYLNWLLDSVVNANMNVLRVWGGGNYETDEFYDACNRLGIMIWQDFMFACSTYPTNPEYLTNVQSEIEYQLYRLRHHPSIIAWAGNNENEAAIATNWYQTDVDKTLYENDFRKLYIDVIRDTVLRIDTEKSRPFISSSPTNGIESEMENWIAKNPYDVRFGDLHYYDYSIDSWNATNYPISRFTSEFGFQSYPSYSLLKSAYTGSGDLQFPSKMNNHRQHHQNGNEQIQNQIQTHFNLIKTTNPNVYFDSIIYLSQINQAMSYKTAIELYRRNRDYINPSTGIGKCMGVMYWQLNDIWQAPTWSSIEFGGKWKMSHYFVKNAFASLLISPFINETDLTLNIFAVSDYTNRTIQDTVQIEIYEFNSFDVKYQETFSFTIQSLASGLVYSKALSEFESSTNCKYNSLDHNCLIRVVASTPQNGENFVFFSNKFNQTNELFGVRVETITKIGANQFNIEITTLNFVSLYVWLDIYNVDINGLFSDNGFHMITPARNVTFTANTDNLTVSDIQKYIIAKSIVPMFY